MSWSSEDLDRIDAADELHIATARGDGSWRPSVPIWAVVVAGDVYVRTWQRRDTGWFGRAVDARRARIRVPGLEADVDVADIGADDADLRAGVDAAYRVRYGRYGTATVAGMVSDDAAAATLRLES